MKLKEEDIIILANAVKVLRTIDIKEFKDNVEECDKMVTINDKEYAKYELNELSREFLYLLIKENN